MFLGSSHSDVLKIFYDCHPSISADYMSEILFITNEPRTRALIEELQPQTEFTIAVETSYSLGIRRIFDVHPAFVFFQEQINDVSCEKPARQVKSILDAEAVRLVLLSEGEVTSFAMISAFDFWFDLTLPMYELCRQILEIINKSPQAADAETLQHPSAEEPPTTLLERTVPVGEVEYSDLQVGEDEEWHLPGEDFDFHALPLAATEESDQTIEIEIPKLSGQQAEFPADFLSDQFSADSSPSFLESEALLPEPPPDLPVKRPASTTPFTEKHVKDFNHIDKESPNQLFGSLAWDSEEENSSWSVPAAKPLRGKVAPAQSEQEPAPEDADDEVIGAPPPRESAASPKVALPEAASPEAEQLAGFPPELGIEPAGGRSHRGIIIFACASAVLCVLLVLVSYSPFASSLVANLIVKRAPPSNSVSLGGQTLPQFIPRIAPDASYAAAHPGWERYQADAVEYLVFREKGRIRAIQVLSGEYRAISLPLVKTCIRLATGSELSDLNTTIRTQDDFRIVSGSAPNGAEVVIYRKIQDNDIRGFVLSFPAQGSPALTDKKHR
jgi:hypothetical protein